jgi:hypothetical protein
MPRYTTDSISLPNPRLRALLTALLLASCGHRDPSPAAGDPPCDVAAARRVVTEFGERLKVVPLLAADSIVRRAIRDEYAPLVTDTLLARWLAHPDSAPGREVSSPWPERIEVRSVEAAGERACVVRGTVIYLTSMEVTHGGAAERVPVTVHVVEDDGWRIARFEAEPPPPAR